MWFPGHCLCLNHLGFCGIAASAGPENLEFGSAFNEPPNNVSADPRQNRIFHSLSALQAFNDREQYLIIDGGANGRFSIW